MHLRFTFKHRSRNEAREKLGPAPWALAYLKLVNDSNGTTVRDGVHDLLVYKIEKILMILIYLTMICTHYITLQFTITITFTVVFYIVNG